MQHGSLDEDQYGDQYEEHNNLMNDIQRIPIDHDKRMESIQVSLLYKKSVFCLNKKKFRAAT